MSHARAGGIRYSWRLRVILERITKASASLLASRDGSGSGEEGLEKHRRAILRRDAVGEQRRESRRRWGWEKDPISYTRRPLRRRRSIFQYGIGEIRDLGYRTGPV